MNPCNIPKKRRAPRRISVLFASLEVGNEFWLPSRKQACIKVGIIRADFHGERFFVNPFRSVFATAPKVAEPESELAQMFREDSQRMQGEVAEVIAAEGSPFAKLATRVFPENSGRTHFVGDSCPGGHADVPPANNDNNITGPTS